MEGVVSLYELDGVSDFLALEDVVIEVQIRHRLLEHLVILGSIAFENGTCRGGRQQRVRRARPHVSAARPAPAAPEPLAPPGPCKARTVPRGAALGALPSTGGRPPPRLRGLIPGTQKRNPPAGHFCSASVYSRLNRNHAGLRGSLRQCRGRSRQFHQLFARCSTAPQDCFIEAHAKAKPGFVSGNLEALISLSCLCS